MSNLIVHRPSRLAATKRMNRVALACSWLAAATTLTLLFSSCASTSVKSTWKSPEYNRGPAQKIAVVADDARPTVRVALENRFVHQLEAASEPAFATAQSFPDLAAARKNKEASVAQLRADGADAMLITRVVSRSDYLAAARQEFTGQYVAVSVTPGSGSWDTSIGSYSTYSSGPRSDDRTHLLLDTSLFDLSTGQRIWACVTEVTVNETDDRFKIADKFVAKVVESLRRDGMIR